MAVSDEELSALMVAIKNRYGLDFTNYEKSSLKRGIVRLMMKHQMDSLLELWSRVLKDSDFFKDAIDDLLVNLTELFRNPDVWLMMRDRVLPAHGSKPLKIWHAGCSTGEEVYTMAIVLEEKGLLNHTRAVATDLSKSALKKAVKGDYPLALLQQYLKPFLKYFPYKRLESFFDFHEKHATIRPQYKSHVEFKSHNLVHDSMHERYDIIFCRNVMIYFDEKLKIQVLKLLHQSLNPGGYLVIGYYDIMPDFGKAIFELYDVKTRIYTRRELPPHSTLL
ncbi:MAG: protein-glutamate O-methyltransferase CheR [Bacteroidota bacterium]